MKIPDYHLKKVCKPGEKGCCAYVTVGGDGWECGKCDSFVKQTIDQRLKEGTMRATGDNCEGPPAEKVYN